ncbi:MAG TPA: type II secretion system protein [Verrucomicrobiota bacterium]|nr:type II secretion system protein [Verrucomicrobiota bacterium]HRT55925.1 type II secretion system protein [Candidatus Paceibacterota bacterium]
MKRRFHSFPSRAGHPAAAAFTMIEIAISLAIIGFALVAIIGILPTGMSVQRENREETIINQDATVFMNAIRNGERGLDDLTNYVVSITNTIYRYDPNGRRSLVGTYWYTPAASSTAQPFPLSSGARIIGLLSRPRWVPRLKPNGSLDGSYSNYVVANVRALSGPASEKFPQTNPDVQELALNYRLIPEVAPYGLNHFDPTWTNFLDPVLYNPVVLTNEIVARSNYFLVATNLQNSIHDVRLTFRWPRLPTQAIGNGRQSFRTSAGGRLTRVVEQEGYDAPEYWLYFFEPRNYARTP